MGYACRLVHPKQSHPSQIISFGTADLPTAAVNLLVACTNTPAVNLRGVGFGDPPFNAAGIAAYQLNLPTAELYDGVLTGIPVGIPGIICIDLFNYILSR